MSDGTDKKAEALEALRKIARDLGEDVMDGNPTRRIHSHVWSLAKNLEVFVEAWAPSGAREREVSEDAPTTVDPQQWPGGKHRATEGDPLYDEMAASYFERAQKQFARRNDCMFYGDFGGHCAAMLKDTKYFCPNCLPEINLEPASAREEALRRLRECLNSAFAMLEALEDL